MENSGRWSANHSRQFNRHYGQMRGFIRREVTRQNLEAELEEHLKLPRRVIDIGGGDGDDARWLAQKKHNVVLADTEPEALKQAAEYDYPVLEDVLLGDSAAALERYGAGAFDLVISHGVLLYEPSPQEELRRLSELLNQGGYLSLLTAGKFGKIKRFEEAGDQMALDNLILSGEYTNHLNLRARAYLPQEVETMLRRAGLQPMNWFGVRIFSDNDDRIVDDVPVFHRNRILQNELLSSRDSRLRPQAQLLHYIARKNA